MRKIVAIMGTLLVILGLVGIAGADLVNPGFETGGFNGWTVNNSSFAEVVTSAQTNDGTPFSAAAGSYFAVASSGLDENAATTISQTVHLNAGQSFVGYALFDGRDYIPFNDYAFVKVNDTTIWTSDIAAVGDYGHTDWVQWVFTAASAGDYNFLYGVVNVGDNLLNSRAFFDGQTSAVPIPGAVWLFGSGLLGLVGIARRRISGERG
jgi:hypothetical protein